MKKVLLVLVWLVTIPAFTQSLNEYEYVIVPIKFEVMKEDDRYHLNTITKMLLQKYGFKSYLSTEEMPAEVANKRCSILYASIEADNSFFATKVKIVLKDCKDQVVYATNYGSSREKEYALGYNQALREAFKSFDTVHYKYNGASPSAEVSSAVTPESTTTNAVIAPVTTTNASETTPELFFFAQPIASGFQIVDSEPRVIMRLFNTSQKNVFIGLRGDTYGVVISKNGQWLFEYYESGKLVSELLKIRF
jgi:hypothetical protein